MSPPARLLHPCSTQVAAADGGGGVALQGSERAGTAKSGLQLVLDSNKEIGKGLQANDSQPVSSLG